MSFTNHRTYSPTTGGIETLRPVRIYYSLVCGAENVIGDYLGAVLKRANDEVASNDYPIEIIWHTFEMTLGGCEETICLTGRRLEGSDAYEIEIRLVDGHLTLGYDELPPIARELIDSLKQDKADGKDDAA